MRTGTIVSDMQILADHAAAAHCSSPSSHILSTCSHTCNGHVCPSVAADIDIDRLSVSLSSFVSNRREYNTIAYSLANNTQLLRYDYNTSSSTAINIDVTNPSNDNDATAKLLTDPSFFDQVLAASPFNRGYLAPITAMLSENGSIIQPIDPTFTIG
jgi:hypothetical protein